MPLRLVSPMVVGRRTELDRFAAAYHRAVADEPNMVLVAGEAGVGKTRFISEATERVGHDARVLSGGCVELGGEGLPFVPIVEALRSLVRATAPADLDRFLGGARHDLARLLPELDPDQSGVTTSDPGATGRLFEHFLGLVGRLADAQPLVVIVEDVHWADRSTLDLLAFLVRALRSERVLVVATYRAEDIHRQHPFRRILIELERLGNVEQIELPRFTRDEVVLQLRGIRGDPPPAAMIDTIFERSEGNAFLVEELVAAVPNQGEHLPAALRDVLLDRVEARPAPTQYVLHAAAAAGQRVGHRLLSRVAAVPEPQLEAALRDMVDHRVLNVEATGGYAFRHALVREAVYDDMLPG